MLSLLDRDRLIFFDIEVFKYDSLVVFMDIEGRTLGVFHNNFEGILDFVKDKTLCGYNNNWYDNFILTLMIDQKTQHLIKKRNDEIIGGKKFSAKDEHQFITSLDCFQQIDVGRPGLKKIEANMGANIYESEIDFTIDRKLTPDEIEETIEYCKYDVKKTIEVFKMREKSYFTPKLVLIEMLPEHMRKKALRWNTTSISTSLLVNKPSQKWSDVRLGEYRKDGQYELFELMDDELVRFWNNNEKGKRVVKEFGCTVEYGFGGIHFVNSDGQKRFKNVKLLDVASLYPNIMLKLNALGDATETFRGLVEQRLEAKREGNGVLSDALKLMINSVYGLLKNEYSMLYNPMASKSVCIYGQIILTDLARRLAPTCKLVNGNTDGLAFVTDSDDYLRVWKEWEEEYGFELELEEYTEFYQENVNNYIGITPEGYIKVKGGDVGRYNKLNPFKNGTTRIVDIAVVENLMYGKDILDVIQENLDKPELFQYVLQAGGTFEGTYDAEGNKYQKVNRGFAVRNHGVQLFKQRPDGSRIMYPKAPDRLLVWNDEVDKFSDFSKVVDVNFYYQLVNDVLERWKEKV